jgi:hypothetical protein
MKLYSYVNNVLHCGACHFIVPIYTWHLRKHDLWPGWPLSNLSPFYRYRSLRVDCLFVHANVCGITAMIYNKISTRRSVLDNIYVPNSRFGECDCLSINKKVHLSFSQGTLPHKSEGLSLNLNPRTNPIIHNLN